MISDLLVYRTYVQITEYRRRGSSLPQPTTEDAEDTEK